MKLPRDCSGFELAYKLAKLGYKVTLIDQASLGDALRDKS